MSTAVNLKIVFFEEFKLIKFTVCLLVQSIKAEKHFELIIDINKLIKLYFSKIIHSFIPESMRQFILATIRKCSNSICANLTTGS